MDYWRPEFTIEHRADGAILMRQIGELPDHPSTLADYLDKWADQTPDQTWLARRVQGGDWRRISYREARASARALGAALLAMGLGPDRPLLILSENSLEHGLLGLACLYVGIPYAPLSPAYSLVSKDHERLKGAADLLNPGAIFADDGDAFAGAIAAIAAPDRHVVTCRNPARGAAAFDGLLAHDPAAADAARAAIGPDTVVKYLFTSGSTGAPKAVINTNAMMTVVQAMIRDCYRFLEYEPPVILDWAPWNHTAAGNKVAYLALTNGGSYYIDDGRPTPDGMAETIRNLREIACTWYFNVPAGHDRLVEALEADEALARTFFSRLRMVFYAGAGMAQHTWDRLAAVGRRIRGEDVLICTSLGATETAPTALSWTEPETRQGNVGVPLKGLTMKLAPTGGKFELRLKGPSIFPGYYGNPEKTAEVFDEEGFYCLGDAVKPVDPDDLTRGLRFDGRLAENFKLSTGTWVAAGAVRIALVDALGGLARDAVIVGENRPALGALLWLSDAAMRMDRADLRAALQARLAAHAEAATGSSGRVTRIAPLLAAPSFDKGELTEKGSINQRALRANHESATEALFEGRGEVIAI